MFFFGFDVTFLGANASYNREFSETDFQTTIKIKKSPPETISMNEVCKCLKLM